MAGALKILTAPSIYNFQHKFHLTILTRWLFKLPPHVALSMDFLPQPQPSPLEVYHAVPWRREAERHPRPCGAWVSSTDDLYQVDAFATMWEGDRRQDPSSNMHSHGRFWFFYSRSNKEPNVWSWALGIWRRRTRASVFMVWIMREVTKPRNTFGAESSSATMMGSSWYSSDWFLEAQTGVVSGPLAIS